MWSTCGKGGVSFWATILAMLLHQTKNNPEHSIILQHSWNSFLSQQQTYFRYSEMYINQRIPSEHTSTVNIKATDPQCMFFGLKNTRVRGKANLVVDLKDSIWSSDSLRLGWLCVQMNILTWNSSWKLYKKYMKIGYMNPVPFCDLQGSKITFIFLKHLGNLSNSQYKN